MFVIGSFFILFSTDRIQFDSVYLSIPKTSEHSKCRGKQQANNVNMLNNIQCLYCVITCTVCSPANLWTGNTKREASVKGNLQSDVWVAVCVPELVLYAQYTSWGDWLAPSFSAELLLICADFTQLSAFIYAWSHWRRAAKQSIPNCYFLVNLLTFSLRFWKNFDFKTHILPFL